MKKYDVTIPISGFIFVGDVEAETPQAAIEKAFEGEYNVEDIAEWEMHHKMVEGNVIHFSPDEATADLVKERKVK